MYKAICNTQHIFVFEDNYWHYQLSYLSFSWDHTCEDEEPDICNLYGRILRPDHGFSSYERRVARCKPSDRALLEKIVQAFIKKAEEVSSLLSLAFEEIDMRLKDGKCFGFNSYIDKPDMKGRVLIYEKYNFDDVGLGCPSLDIKDYSGLVRLLPVLVKGGYEADDLLDVDYFMSHWEPDGLYRFSHY